MKMKAKVEKAAATALTLAVVGYLTAVSFGAINVGF